MKIIPQEWAQPHTVMVPPERLTERIIEQIVHVPASRILEETDEVQERPLRWRCWPNRNELKKRTTERVVDVPLVIQRQVPTIQKVQKFPIELSQSRTLKGLLVCHMRGDA